MEKKSRGRLKGRKGGRRQWSPAHEIAVDFPEKLEFTLWGLLAAQQGRFEIFFQLFGYLGSNALNLKDTKPPLPS